ncbi:CoA-acylating methylmalonate-semialdehyde dehydrogenase [Pseudenhygromyxa sp. WMMC2535]|uniref:CoA-acylating methylmalonate-semialdehyde dehydrogenase n=1 Tax=Pseudenhygromyxa sp. WMMC2535 TaxID=2712867 RepID=UPI001551966A|nr:CoA-acylating methylmalonate-semialdehyde dehydrogenase [Pseudenhygromyxa sp. WMMC2535]NVB42072.1 CoA-acylating methylmalonate-semialdehyde dehydrogenase [Pseudenhygromyxa sp. WMMC2535]
MSEILGKFQADSYAFLAVAPAQNWIGGEWREASTGERAEVINPRYGRAMSSTPMSAAADVDAAVSAAAAAWVEWRAWPMRERAHVFYRLRDLMNAERESLAWLVSHENGKVYAQALAEVDKAIECVEFGCSLPNMAGGPQLEVSRGVHCQLVHEPLGVVAGVTPFNFPLMVPLWMIPQAIVSGNCFVLKASERVPLSTIRLAELFEQAGLPKGVFNLVHGGKASVEALCDHPQIRALAFVGSTPVAKLVYGRAAAAGKAALCLGGAKNHLIVVPDADLELTAENVVASFTGCSGQRCMAAANLVAVGDVDDIIAAIAERAAKLVPGSDHGAITSAAAAERIRGYIDAAEQSGAKVLVDGRQKRGEEAGGYWLGATVLDGVPADSPAAREEIFGPVLSIIRVPTLEAAIAFENASPYGNASSIYTTSGHIAREVMGRVEAGMCGVNIGVPVPREPFGFGGWNDSKFGHGDITGWDGFRFWTRPRKITTKWALQKDWTWMS